MDFEFVVIDKEQVIGGLMVKLSWVKAPAHFEVVHYLYGESIVFY
jgi:hypothetical protein